MVLPSKLFICSTLTPLWMRNADFILAGGSKTNYNPRQMK